MCKVNNISCTIRNLALFNFCNKFKQHNLEDLYQGKYSLKKKDEDFYIFNKDINFRDEIKPRLPTWLENKILIKTETEKKDTMVKFSISALKLHSYFSELIITKNNGNVTKKTYIPDNL